MVKATRSDQVYRWGVVCVIEDVGADRGLRGKGRQGRVNEAAGGGGATSSGSCLLSGVQRGAGKGEKKILRLRLQPTVGGARGKYTQERE